MVLNKFNIVSPVPMYLIMIIITYGTFTDNTMVRNFVFKWCGMGGGYEGYCTVLNLACIVGVGVLCEYSKYIGRR